MRSSHLVRESTANRSWSGGGTKGNLILSALVAALPVPLLIAFFPSILPLLLLGAAGVVIWGLVSGWRHQRQWEQQQRNGQEAKGEQDFYQQCEPNGR